MHRVGLFLTHQSYQLHQVKRKLFKIVFIIMGKLIKEWVKNILTENIENKVIVYSGRFQPFHSGHYAR